MQHNETTTWEGMIAFRPCPDRIERELMRAYVQLAVTPSGLDGSRAVTLKGLGAHRVCLTELPRARIPPTMPPLWIEIFSPAGETIDGCGCFDLGEDELTDATQIIADLA
ncbi:hypothetical protein [Microvirga splendida]|uniref:PilZ domain-containing protein n=1 Tax=Microvirga splendida TaxID=2795727 RepID=A0ABS0Y8A0_9HYPH|nr:hypothetical protein [Microvirga splendida]MBJ6128532.1 hypothetical protein [Microvirga splendida]